VNHIILFIICALCVEIFINCKFIYVLNSILNTTRKVTKIIPQQNISDHWKERAIPAYALKIMTSSLRIFLILLVMIILFVIADYIFKGFVIHALSLFGIMESIIFAFIYIFLRKFFIK